MRATLAWFGDLGTRERNIRFVCPHCNRKVHADSVPDAPRTEFHMKLGEFYRFVRHWGTWWWCKGSGMHPRT